MDVKLPAPNRAADRAVTGSRSQKQARSADRADVADLDRAAQLGPHRYRDGQPIRILHRLETEHFRYVGKVAGEATRARRLRVDVLAVSECARLYLEGEGAYWRHCEIPIGDFGDHVARLEGTLKGYWGPALSPAR